MKKYLVLYRSEAAIDGPSISEMFANTPPEQLQQGLAAWSAWYQNAGEAIVDYGAPLENATIVSADASTLTKTSITGFTVIQADSLEAATQLASAHPHLRMPGATIEVLEGITIPGM